MYLSIEEAALLVTTKLTKEFGNEKGKVDVVKAASAIFSNADLDIENLNPRHYFKAVRDMLVVPTACLHHRIIWTWAGLELSEVFNIKS